MAKLSEVLQERGYVHQFSSATLSELTDDAERTVYLGIDPSADSLHVGNLQAMLVLRNFLEHGHKVVLLIGGGTGMVGDPSGKNEERNLLDDDTIESNTRGIEAQAKRLFAGAEFALVNNAEWLRPLNLLEFLRDIGKHFSVNAMLQRDSVKNRIENQEQGISFTEFSYMLLQAYDFLYLFNTKGVDVQIGASDQWGNIASGIDLIRRKSGKTAYAFTSPLLINRSSGKKFGKSEDGAVWLDPKKTTPFQFYQFFLNIEDESVGELLLRLTLLKKSVIDDVMMDHSKNPAARFGQRRLAREVTELVHGKEETDRAERATELLFGEAKEFDKESLRAIAEFAPTCSVEADSSIVDVLVSAKLASSKREARQFLDDKAVSLNGALVNADTKLSADTLRPGAILKRGKRNVCVLHLRA